MSNLSSLDDDLKSYFRLTKWDDFCSGTVRLEPIETRWGLERYPTYICQIPVENIQLKRRGVVFGIYNNTHGDHIKNNCNNYSFYFPDNYVKLVFRTAKVIRLPLLLKITQYLWCIEVCKRDAAILLMYIS